MSFVPDLLERGVRRAPDRYAVVQADVALTFAQVHRRAAAVAGLLTDSGVGPGDRVLLLAANEPELLELQVACQRIGAVLVPANFRLAQPELEAIVADCGPAVLVHSAAYAEAAAVLDVPRPWCLGRAATGGDYEQWVVDRVESQGDALPLWAPIRAEATAQLLYTSGTTGTAKGAVTTNAALFARIAAFVASHRLDERDVFLQTLPLFHLASLVSFAYTSAGPPA